MASQGPSRLIGQIMDLLRKNPKGGETRACASAAINESLFLRYTAGAVDLSDTDNYVAFFGGASEFSVSPPCAPPAPRRLLGKDHLHECTDSGILPDSGECARQQLDACEQAWGGHGHLYPRFPPYGKLSLSASHSAIHGSRMVWKSEFALHVPRGAQLPAPLPPRYGHG